ncbi:dihydroorotase [Chitinophaga sp.]|uniref:dihydroorotase n=1 Tax=Chitinophaga sp. TaxID=1869181 RepID=UPI0026104F39|nr:dihydroorotase [uncultured Chitinophaga sp.]
MQILLKSATIVSEHSPFNGQQKDVLIDNGVIASISDNIAPGNAQVISGNGLHVSGGWMDVFAHFCDPGQEYKEDLQSGALAAAAGGYTAVMIVPNTQPALHTKTQIAYVQNQAPHNVAEILPIGAITKNLEGASLAEMYEMKDAGAVAFSDGLKPVQSSGLLLKALQYVKAFNGAVIQIPDDASISAHGLMHEGIHSTRLGMPGKPAIAEEIMLKRDLDLLEYTNSRLHVTGVSTRGSIQLIADAKARGLQVTCSVTPYHLLFTDADLASYDSFLKVNPPLRTQDDVDALRAAVADGTVDCIASHHQPQDWDAKQVEFEYAKYGMIGLETAFAALRAALPDLEPAKLARLLSDNPRSIFGQPAITIKEGAVANLTVFEPNTEYTLSDDRFQSKSRNTPFLGKPAKGSVTGIIRQNKSWFRS